VSGELVRQREALAALGLSPVRPPLDLATSAPQEYAALLARASQVADLTATGGLGDFYWVLSGAGGVVPSLGGG
jgi:hypothetical protein